MTKDEIVKDLSFGTDASSKIMAGVNKLASAVKSTLGASGMCVIYEDQLGRPVVTKDGVTVARNVVLMDPVENIGATMIKEAANKTVAEAGDGTTTSTVLAQSILEELRSAIDEGMSVREAVNGVNSYLNKVLKHLDKNAIEVNRAMLSDVATISCNNDRELGEIIGKAYDKVGRDGVVTIEKSDTYDTYLEFIEGAQFASGLQSQYFATDTAKLTAEYENPLILLSASEIGDIRKIRTILEYSIKQDRPLLIVASVDDRVLQILMANVANHKTKINVVEPPGFGPMREDAIQDLAFLTGATVLNENLGDDFELASTDILGEAKKVITDNKTTTIMLESVPESISERIEDVKNKINSETNDFLKKKHEARLATLTGKLGVIKVGAHSEIEYKEKYDRVEDAVYATKAAYKEGIVAGGGVALANASTLVHPSTTSEIILSQAIKAPYHTILTNANLPILLPQDKDWGIDVKSGKDVNMIEAGIIDPVLVTKTALINAVSVANTIISADCVISNKRIVG